MRPKTVTVTSSNSPYLIPLDTTAQHTAIQVDAIGTIDYTVAYSVQNILGIASPATNADWTPITGMTGATADAVYKLDQAAAGLRITVNSGAGSVEVHILQAG